MAEILTAFLAGVAAGIVVAGLVVDRVRRGELARLAGEAAAFAAPPSARRPRGVPRARKLRV